MSDEPERPEQLPLEVVSRDDTRALVDEMLMIFDPGWISKLSEKDDDILNSEFGPKKITVRANTIEVFDKPCPPELCEELDLALGRRERMQIQGRTVDHWIETVAGFDLTKRYFLRANLEHAMSLYREKARAAVAADVPRNKPGPEPVERDRVARAMIADVRSGELTVTALRSMTQEAMAAEWKTKRGTAAGARKQALAELEPGDPLEGSARRGVWTWACTDQSGAPGEL
jgi:hypothetical protein